MDQETILKIVREFSKALETEQIKPQKIILYGSCSTQTQRPDSDIDLVVISEDFVGKGYWERIDILSAAICRVFEPIEAVANPDTISVPADLVRRRRAFALRVKGDSMIDEHICDGDTVILEAREAARPGETVVALVEGRDATLKRFYRQGSRIRLQPANPEVKPILVAAGNVEIQGKVMTVIRQVA